MADSGAEVPPPYGMGTYDPRALNSQQQNRLWEFKINTRIANEYYLRNHPEVDVLLGEFMRSVLQKRPKNIREFASEYYTNAKLPERILRILQERQRAMS
ncbi:RIIa domain-containing protein 1-like [Heptranchias perlo]|uniref:RIIa domain-containing protein 1-like n=1 Tax=Heptranchias perlo TaxID=212740 RepID=UPI00355A24AB